MTKFLLSFVFLATLTVSPLSQAFDASAHVDFSINGGPVESEDIGSLLYDRIVYPKSLGLTDEQIIQECAKDLRKKRGLQKTDMVMHSLEINGDAENRGCYVRAGYGINKEYISKVKIRRDFDLSKHDDSTYVKKYFSAEIEEGLADLRSQFPHRIINFVGLEIGPASPNSWERPGVLVFSVTVDPKLVKSLVLKIQITIGNWGEAYILNQIENFHKFLPLYLGKDGTVTLSKPVIAPNCSKDGFGQSIDCWQYSYKIVYK